MTTTNNLIVRCVNAHDRCEGSHPCPLCEPKTPLRTEDGRFAAVAGPVAGRTIAQMAGE